MRILLAIFLSLVFCSSSSAQVIPPSADGFHEKPILNKRYYPALTASRLLRIEGSAAEVTAPEIDLKIDKITLRGSSVFTPDEIDALTEEFVGPSKLVSIYRAAAKLTAKYRNDGYILSRVIVPPQELDPEGATIELEAIEGYVDKVLWPQETSSYRDLFSDYTVAMLASRPTNIKTIERYLLLASDLPGLQFNSRLEASESNPRASALIIDMSHNKIEGSIGFKNYGTKSRGPAQIAGSGLIKNILGQHEQFTVAYSGSTEFEEATAFSSRYQQVLNSEGLTLNVDLSLSSGKPDSATLRSLMFESQSIAFNAGLVFPVVRERERNFMVSMNVFATDARSMTFGQSFSEDRLRGVRLGASYSFLGNDGSANSIQGELSLGVEGFGSTSTGNILASRQSGRPDFAKLNFSSERVQRVTKDISLKVSAEGQISATPLLASEECTFGGRKFGRAFDAGALAGDHCLSVSMEISQDYSPNFPAIEDSQGYIFGDLGQVWRIAPATGTPTTQTAASIGLGLRTNWANDVTSSMELSQSILGGSSTKFGVELQKGF